MWRKVSYSKANAGNVDFVISGMILLQDDLYTVS